MNLYKKVILTSAIATVGLGAASSCSKDDSTSPQFKIVELGFGYYKAQRAVVEDVQAAFATGADSVYLVSNNDFKELGTGTMQALTEIARKLVNVNPSRTKGCGVVECKNIYVSDKAYLEQIGFKVNAGKVYQ